MFSIQNNRLWVLSNTNIITNIPNTNGIIYVPDTIFQIREIVDVSAADIIWALLSSPRYLGANPTEAKDTTDRNGRN